MSFKIKSVLTDGEWLELTSHHSDGTEGNVFTLVVGPNATGKSRLLRKIVSTYLFTGQSSARDRYLQANPQMGWDYHLSQSDVPEVWVADFSQKAPSNVIAVSTGRHDRFPSPSHMNQKKTASDYHYIAPSNNGSFSTLTQSLIAIIEGLQDYQSKSAKLADIFKYLDFAPVLDVKFAFETERQLKSRGSPAFNIMEIVQSGQNPYFLDAEEDVLLEKFQRFYTYHTNKSKFSIEIDLGDEGSVSGNQEIDDLVSLLKAGLVKISDLTLLQMKTKNRLRFSQASSGQQCMLTMILGIAGAIRHESLICIDEPEISLHPKWQEDIIRQLQTAFSDYHGCHFIIATHSPQILSGLTTNDGYVLSLEDKKLYHSQEYSRRSADFQLAEIFNAPGQNNEYLVRLILTLLTKVARYQPLTEEDRSRIAWLSKLKDAIGDNDPVWHLIDQLQVLGS